MIQILRVFIILFIFNITFVISSSNNIEIKNIESLEKSTPIQRYGSPYSGYWDNRGFFHYYGDGAIIIHNNKLKHR